MSWQGVRVLVTGAGGFIGSHLTEELLRRGARVRALVHYNGAGRWGWLDETDPALLRRCEIVSGDVTDPAFMAEAAAGRTVVFHLAALIGIPYSYRAPASYVRTNVLGTLNVLEACRRAKVRKVVHTSTSEVYGTARYVPIDEGHPLVGQSPYSASKIGADHLAESFHRSFGLPVAVARPFNTFGPRQSARAVIPTILTQLLAGAPEIRLGSLAPVRDFNFVSDTVAGFLAVAASPRSVGETVNLGSGRGVSVRAVVAAAERIAGRRIRVVVEKQRLRPAASEVLKLVCGNAKARRLLGWRPRVRFEDGLRATAQWLRGRAQDPKSRLFNV